MINQNLKKANGSKEKFDLLIIAYLQIKTNHESMWLF